jgi:hypothetical protein
MIDDIERCDANSEDVGHKENAAQNGRQQV